MIVLCFREIIGQLLIGSFSNFLLGSDYVYITKQGFQDFKIGLKAS